MADRPGKFSVFVKIGLALAVVAGAVAGALYAFRSEVKVTPAWVGTAADAVSGSVVVHANGDVKELKSEVGGRVKSLGPLVPDGRFQAGDVLLELDPYDIDTTINDANREQANGDAVQRAVFASVPEWGEARQVLDAKEKALADKQTALVGNTSPEAAAELSRLAADVKQARAALDEIAFNKNQEVINIRREVDNMQRLADRGEVATIDLEQRKNARTAVETRVKVAAVNEEIARENFKARMLALQHAKEKMSLRAPDPGQVNTVLVYPGALIGGGQTVATWYSNERIIVAKIREEDISRVKIGQRAEVTLLKFPEEYFRAKVTKILTSADPETQRYTVYLELTDKSQEKGRDILVPFATGEVTITIDERPGRLLILSTSVFNDNMVAVVEGNTVVHKKIKIGFRGLNQLEVLPGDKNNGEADLKPGDLVIAIDPSLTHPGQRVTVDVKEFK